MAIFHVHANYIKPGGQRGGVAGFATYLNREHKEDASQFHRYLNRTMLEGKDDLVARGAANLPRWAAGDAAVFWKAAETYERKDYIVARHLQISLPRELSREGQLDLADDIRAVTVGKFTHSWAIHEPEAKDGSGTNPHIHILFSPRREDMELQRTPAQWFAKAAAHDKNPLLGGVRKDRAWEKKGHLYDIRATVALLTNVALAREGIGLAVDARNLRAQGIERPPMAYHHRFNEAQATEVQGQRLALRETGGIAAEERTTYAAWQRQARTLPSLDRAAIRDLCREHVWRYDPATKRSAERDAVLQRIFAWQPQQTRQRPIRIPRIPRVQDPAQTRGPILAPDLGRMHDKVQGLTW